MTEPATIIPVAGGKGGVGKTLLTANLGFALGELGFPTIVADLDLGNSNLHSLLGLPNKYPGIGDFLRIGNAPLDQFLVDTGHPDLKFLPGDGRMPFMANITYAQKNQLIAKLRELPARYVLLDLGAGCAFHTLDFFAMADRGIVVSTPEFPAVMSTLVFLKNFVMRLIERSLPKDPDLTDWLQELYVQPMNAPQMTIELFLEHVSTRHPEAAPCIKAVCTTHRPRLVFNMCVHPDDLKWLQSLNRTAQEILSIEMDHFGFIFTDPAVRESIQEGKLLLAFQPESAAAREILAVARRVSRFWDTAVPESLSLLSKHVWEAFEKKQQNPGSSSKE